jgi:endogenous inhibitor of DNA gyrase (YacG/DUF329 family)
MKCPICNIKVKQQKKGRTKLYCSKTCKILMDSKRRKNIYAKPKECFHCKQTFEWKPYLKYCSNSCKRFAQNARNRTKKSFSICAICGSQAIGSNTWIRKYCSFECQLKGIYGGKPPLSERSRKAQRNMRERNAPGLTYLEIRDLRIQWQKDGLVCVYCAGPFDTIDHVIPLTRGGDNMKSNLVPACRSCNSSKGQKLLSEWMPHLDRG